MKSFRSFLTESSLPVVALYHGGRGLESRYQDTVSHSKGNWEYGPGLYLTTHYDTAYKYAKGGGKVYKVTVEQGKNAEDVDLERLAMDGFVRQYVLGRKRQEVWNALHAESTAGNVRALSAELFTNVILNHQALSNTKSGALKDFLAAQGVDYRIVTRFGGRDETLMVVVNGSKIKNVSVVSPKTKEFELPFRFE